MYPRFQEGETIINNLENLMEIKLYFNVISNDGIYIGIEATAILSGKYILADFNHDIEDDRECIVESIICFNEDGEESDLTPTETLTEIVYEHIDDNTPQIFSEAMKSDDDIFLSDFKSDHDFSDLT
jgi:hypothetical protein